MALIKAGARAVVIPTAPAPTINRGLKPHTEPIIAHRKLTPEINLPPYPLMMLLTVVQAGDSALSVVPARARSGSNVPTTRKDKMNTGLRS